MICRRVNKRVRTGTWVIKGTLQYAPSILCDCGFHGDDHGSCTNGWVVLTFQRVHLDIQVGEHTNNYPEIAAKDKLTELQLRVRQLLDQVEQIQKEQNYQRVSEERRRSAAAPRLTPAPVSSVPRGAFPSDEREHQPARPVVVHRPDPHPHRHRHLADEASQELLRGQEAGVVSVSFLIVNPP